MVRAILRPLFQRAQRGFNTPQGRMFTAFGIGPQVVNRLTDPPDEVVNQLLYPTNADDITTDISDVTSKDPETLNQKPTGPVDSGGPSVNAQNESKQEEDFNTTSLTDEVGSSDVDEFASSETNNNPAITDYIDNDSVQRINGYKDIIRNFIGDSKGDKLQKVALLMQIGSSLMTGRTNQPGLRGFFDVVGQTGQQTAPLLFEMGLEKSRADREIGAAALDLYFQQLEDLQDRSGPYVMVYQNYKTNVDGSLSLDATGQPIKLEKPRKVLTVKRTSPEESKFYQFNQDFGFDVFSFVEAGEGQDAFGLNYADSVNVEGDAAADAQRSYAEYVKRGLVPLANDIIPLLINRPELTGASGELGEIIGPAYEFLNEFTDLIVQGEFDSGSDTGSGFAVRERSNGTMMLNGVEVPIFVDYDNKYGGNGIFQDRDGAALTDENYGTDANGNPARAYVVADTFTKLLRSGGERNVLETFKTTLGLMLARDRQPTGRMLADVLRRSFEDVDITSFGGRQVSDKAVIQNYVSIYKQLYNNMSRALDLAGYNKDTSPQLYEIEGTKKLENSYYNWILQNNLEERTLNLDIPGGIGFAPWRASNEGNIIMNHEEDMKNSETTYESILEEFNLN